MTGRGFCLACLAAWVALAALALDLSALDRLLAARAEHPLAYGLLAASLAFWSLDCLLVARFLGEED